MDPKAIILALAIVAQGVAVGGATPGADSAWTARGPIRRFLSWEIPPPDPLAAALRSYAEGSLFEALAGVSAAQKLPATEPYRGEARLLQGLALHELGWFDLASESLVSVLDEAEPGPRNVHAFRSLIETWHRAGRVDRVAAAYLRYIEILPTKAARRFGDLSVASGVRKTGRWWTLEEIELLSDRGRLKEKLARGSRRREGLLDRPFYLAGLALLRIGRHRESIHAFERIGLLSPYYPYAIHAAAQACYAVGDSDRAIEILKMLLRYPVVGPSGTALADRARVFLAEAVAAGGRGDEARALLEEIARRSGGILAGHVSLAIEEPSLAAAYYGALGRLSLGPRLEAERALGIVRANRLLGNSPWLANFDVAASSGGWTARDRTSEARALRELARNRAGAVDERRARSRRQMAMILRSLIARRAPAHLGEILRRVFGSPLRRERGPAEETDPRPTSPGEAQAWVDYLRSPLRAPVDAGLLWLVRAESLDRGDSTAIALHLLEAHLGWLAAELPRAEGTDPAAIAAAASALVESLRREGGPSLPEIGFDLSAPLAPQIAGYRRRLLRGGFSAPAPRPGGETRWLIRPCEQARLAMEDGIASAIGRIVDEGRRELDRLELDLRREIAAYRFERRVLADAGAARETARR